MSKPDFVTCAVCRTVIARRKTILWHEDEGRCADYDACRDRRIARDNQYRAERAREEAERWDEQFNPRRRNA